MSDRLKERITKIKNTPSGSDLPSYREYWQRQEPEEGLGEADWFPGESMVPAGIIKGLLKGGLKSMIKQGRKAVRSPKRRKKSTEEYHEDFARGRAEAEAKRKMAEEAKRNNPKNILVYTKGKIKEVKPE